MSDTLVLGLDGIDFRQLQKRRDKLPVLDGLFEDGVWGELRSTIPPATSAAWTTALSGMSPGRTGITDFGVGDAPGKDEGVVNSTDVQTPRIWDVVEAQGGRSAVIGVPVTYPATKVDGLMVSGFMTRSNKRGHVYPAELAAELPDDYRFFIPYSDYGSSDALLNDIYASTDAKFEFLERVLRGEVTGSGDNLDLVCFVLSEPDWIQHYFLRQPEEPDAEEGREVVREYLTYVDGKIGEVLSVVDDRTIGLLSDHGFGKCSTHHVYLNEWLSRQGHLYLRNDGGQRYNLRRTVGRRIRDVAKIPGFRYIKNKLPKSAKQAAIDLATLDGEDINWERTRAIFRKKFSNTGYVELNRDAIDARKVDGFIEELVADIDGLTDPSTGEKIVEEVHRREDYYSGPHVESIPEIVFVFEERYTGNEQVGGTVVKQMPRGGRPNPAHRMGGFFCLAGADVTDSHRVDTDIHRFAPSLYRAIGLPLPDPIDGEPIDEIPGDRRHAMSKTVDFDPEFVVDAEESTDVEQRLSDLGYL